MGASILGTNTGSTMGASPGSLMGAKAQADMPMNNQEATQDLQSEAMAMGAFVAAWAQNSRVCTSAARDSWDDC